MKSSQSQKVFNHNIQYQNGRSNGYQKSIDDAQFGSGFDCIEMRGSAHNDIFNPDESTKTNHSGGIQGGISNGMPIKMRIAFKPVATIVHEQETIDSHGTAIKVIGKGRHDPCVVPRAVPIVESMAAIIILDMIIRAKALKA